MDVLFLLQFLNISIIFSNLFYSATFTYRERSTYMNTITNIKGAYNTPYQNKSLNIPAGYSNKNNVQFKGISNLRRLSPNFKYVQEEISKTQSMISFNTHLPIEDIEEVSNGVSMKRLGFLYDLSRAYNRRHSHTANGSTKEDAKIVLDIFNSVKKPHEKHFYIVNTISGSLENIGKILKGMGNSKKRFELVRNIKKQIMTNSKEEVTPNLIADMLTSKYVDTYAKDFEKYKPYLLNNKADKNVVKNLDKMIEEGTFNIAEYNKNFSMTNVFGSRKLPETNVLNLKTIQENYTEEGSKFLNEFVESYGGVNSKNVTEGSDKDILAMYKTTTKKNLSLRLGILKLYSELHTLENKTYSEKSRQNIRNLHKLFNMADKNTQVFNFLNKMVKNGYAPLKLSTLNNIVETTPSHKLGKLGRTMKSYASNIPVHDNDKAYLSDYEIDTINHRMKYNVLDDIVSAPARVYNFISEKIEAFRYRHFTAPHDKNAVYYGVRPEPLPVATPTVSKVDKPIAESVSTTAKVIVSDTEKAQETTHKTRPIRTSRVVAKAPNAKKLEVINDVNAIIEKKLGSKTISEQKHDYAVTATKMRMQMLPEIFESIKDTRAAERASGKKLSVSNKDAIDLYSIIKGRNKKLVNYMLKKRNSDGTRMYTVKDIITTVKQAEQKICANKNAAPKTYKAADAKAYYNTLLDSQIQQYGKLTKKQK